MEIDEIWMLMMKVPKRRHTKVRRITNKKVQLTVRLCINKASGQQQHKIWKPGELKTTEVEQQHARMDAQQQHKVWDPGRLQLMEFMIRRS
jgi:hypothetical protein